MRIVRLYVKQYGNLQEFEFKPDQQHQTSVILGRNGAGKSNLMEVLVEIFRDLESGTASGFYYELEYLIRGYSVEVANNPDGKPRQQVLLDGSKISMKRFRDEADTLLPKYVFAYYSGWNKRLESLFDKPTADLYRKWLKGGIHDNIPLRRMFFCRKQYSQFSLLAFFLLESRNEDIQKFLRDYLKIDGFESALFVMHKPFWRTSKPKKAEMDEGDPLFWHAIGAFQSFLDRLWRHALAPIRHSEMVTKDFRNRSEDAERFYLFIKDLPSLRGLKYPGESIADFFAHLEGLYLSDLLEEIRITVRTTDGSLIRFENLSEGEQQLLTVLGLLHISKSEESLFLLDEPDTHLNPAWTYEYLNLLQEQVVEQTSQLLIASHNPLMIGGLKKEQVRLLRRRTDDNGLTQVKAYPPDEDPIGMGVDGLLQSEIFGLKSVLPPSVVERLTERYKLLGIRNKTEEMSRQLKSLTDELDQMGIAHSFPHPYFNQFAQTLARNPLMNKRDFTADELDELEEITDDMLQAIIDGRDPEEGR